MPVSLKKGEKVSLNKNNPGLKNIIVGLGWDTNAYDTGGSFDLDSAAFLVGENGKVTSSGDFVFYGNLNTAAVQLSIWVITELVLVLVMMKLSK